MERWISPQEIDTKHEIEELATACSDLNEACVETKTTYLVVGSLASVCAVGQLYRIPGDVDGWYDISNADTLRTSLEKKGYIREVIEAKGNPFLYPLEHFKKGDSIIELRGANFTGRGLEYPVRFPIPGIPLNKRPLGQLVYTKSLAIPHKARFGSATVMIASKEALWIGLKTTLPFIQLVGKKTDKRLLDLSMLAKHLDMDTVKKMLAEKPGLYYKNTPIFTTGSHRLFSLLETSVKLKKQMTRSHI